MEDRTNAKLGLGSTLAIIGGIGFILGPTLGLTDLAGPWSFLAGLVAGMTAGTGSALTIGALLERRESR